MHPATRLLTVACPQRSQTMLRIQLFRRKGKERDHKAAGLETWVPQLPADYKALMHPGGAHDVQTVPPVLCLPFRSGEQLCCGGSPQLKALLASCRAAVWRLGEEHLQPAVSRHSALAQVRLPGALWMVLAISSSSEGARKTCLSERSVPRDRRL